MDIFVNKFSFFKPSDENLSETPKLEYVDPLFKRRLSQISRMTIQVVHDVVESAPDSKLVFASFRGELARQMKINKGLVEDLDVMPAQFSISVFNTPPAVASIALNMKAGYTAIYPSEDNFKSALISAVSPILCGSEKQIIFAYADELIPDEYKSSYRGKTVPGPLAFACVLSSEKTENSIKLDLDAESPEEFFGKISKM